MWWRHAGEFPVQYLVVSLSLDPAARVTPQNQLATLHTHTHTHTHTDTHVDTQIDVQRTMPHHYDHLHVIRWFSTTNLQSISRRYLYRKIAFSENVVYDLDLWILDLENVIMSCAPGNEYFWRVSLKYVLELRKRLLSAYWPRRLTVTFTFHIFTL